MSLHFNISDRGASPVFQRLPTASRQVTFNTVSEASLHQVFFPHPYGIRFFVAIYR